MQQENVWEKVKYWFLYDRIPVTKTVIVANVLTFLLLVLSHSGAVAHYLGFNSIKAIAMPWTFFTYSLLGATGVLSLLFACYWMWFVGGSLERAWGSKLFAAYFFLMSGASALGLYVGGLILGWDVYLSNIWLPLAGATVAFAMSNPEQPILVFFVVPMKLKYLALLDVALVFVSYASQNFILGFFALSGCALSYWYVRSGRELFGLPTRRRRHSEVIRIRIREADLGSRRIWNPIRWYQEWRRRKQIEDLFKRSGFGD